VFLARRVVRKKSFSKNLLPLAQRLMTHEATFAHYHSHLAEKGPSIVSKLLAQLDESGEQDVVMWYEQAKAALDSVPMPGSVAYHLSSKPKSAPLAA
jgi:hypothetical protein